MTQEELRDRVLGHQFSETRYSLFINDMLNEAQRRIARRADLRLFFDNEDLPTTASNPQVVFPADFARLHSLENTDTNQHLNWLEVTEFDELLDDSAGCPTQYTVLDDQAGLNHASLWPIPDAVYTLKLWYHRRPVDITEAVEPEIPEDWQHLLVTYTLARCYRRENDSEQAVVHMQEFERDLAELQADLQDDVQDAVGIAQVPGMWMPSRGISVQRP